jgi:hypothetical protein
LAGTDRHGATLPTSGAAFYVGYPDMRLTGLEKSFQFGTSIGFALRRRFEKGIAASY